MSPISEVPQRKTSDDEDGEIGDFGEEINDLNDVPIEKPKCLSSINNNMAEKTTSRLRRNTT